MKSGWQPRALALCLAWCLSLSLSLVLGTGAAMAQTVWLAGPEGSAMSLADALQKAQDGDTIELLAGEYSGGLVIEQRRLTLRGMAGSKPPVIKGNGKPASSKGLWTVRGGQVTLQNLEFRGARSADGSGAGLRHEGGELNIERCNFFDNEHGVFSSNDDKAQLRIDGSAFGMAPKVVGGLQSPAGNACR